VNVVLLTVCEADIVIAGFSAMNTLLGTSFSTVVSSTVAVGCTRTLAQEPTAPAVAPPAKVQPSETVSTWVPPLITPTTA
jgi:hypothetical protein